MDNSFQQPRNKMLPWKKTAFISVGFEKASTTTLNKNAHRMDKSSDWVVQITKEMVTALGRLGLRC